MAFLVNSSPRAGHMFEPSVTVADAAAALDQAVGLSRRGMRLIRIRNLETGEILDERGLRRHIEAAKTAASQLAE